MKGLKLWVETH